MLTKDIRIYQGRRNKNQEYDLDDIRISEKPKAS